MDHAVVVRQKMTERYLLDELDPTVKDEFEEHFFGCAECAEDVRAASLFIERSKTVLAAPAESVAAPMPAGVRAPRGWFAWLRPAIAAPALAALLLVVGYQNLVTLPGMSKTSRPQVLPWTSVNVGTFSGEGNQLIVPKDSGFVLFVRIPPDGTYSRYTADLYNPKGELEWSLAIPAAEGQDQWPVEVPAANRAPGRYALVVRGTAATGQRQEVGRTSFELQVQK